MSETQQFGDHVNEGFRLLRAVRAARLGGRAPADLVAVPTGLLGELDTYLTRAIAFALLREEEEEAASEQ